MTCHCPSSLPWGTVHPEAFQQRGKAAGTQKQGLPERLQVSINLRTKFWNLSSGLGGGGHTAISCKRRECGFASPGGLPFPQQLRKLGGWGRSGLATTGPTPKRAKLQPP